MTIILFCKDKKYTIRGDLARHKINHLNSKPIWRNVSSLHFCDYLQRHVISCRHSALSYLIRFQGWNNTHRKKRKSTTAILAHLINLSLIWYLNLYSILNSTHTYHLFHISIHNIFPVYENFNTLGALSQYPFCNIICIEVSFCNCDTVRYLQLHFILCVL